MLIRRMTPGDMEEVARLSGQLGYPATEEEMAQRFFKVNTDFKQTVFVAEDLDQNILGWIHAKEDTGLIDGPRVQVGALIVDSEQRGKGMGSALLGQIEKWAKERGIDTIHFTSRTIRTDAHRLYQRLGYEVDKTSFNFVKKI